MAARFFTMRRFSLPVGPAYTPHWATNPNKKIQPGRVAVEFSVGFLGATAENTTWGGVAGSIRVLQHQEFVSQFLREERYLAAYLLSATGDVHAAEDLLQNVARVLWEKLVDYDESRPFGAWATGVAQLEVLKWRQRVARVREILSEDSMRLLSETAAQHAAEVNEQYFFLADCLQALGASARAVLEMKYAQDCKIRDIACRLQKSTASIEMILVRSRRTLRECIQRKASQAQG